MERMPRSQKGSGWQRVAVSCCASHGGTSSSHPCLAESLPSSAFEGGLFEGNGVVFFCGFLANTPPAGARRVGPPNQKGLVCVVQGAGGATRWSCMGKDSSWDGAGESLHTPGPMQALLIRNEGEINLEKSLRGMLMPKGDA